MRLDWASLLDILRGSERVCLTSHIRPDCDALGSELGLAAGLERSDDVQIYVDAVRFMTSATHP